jgi:dihydropteroate synthase
MKSTPQSERRSIFRLGSKEYDLAARTHVIGVVNVTPDSFSDGGRYLDPARAVRHALELIEEGADIIDVGGESTRPRGAAYGEGAEPVPPELELGRVLPVIERLVRETDIPISVDTYKAAVAGPALASGAVIVNDISAFHFDEAMPRTVAAANGSAILMHIRGTPKTMQIEPRYDELFGEITSFLREGVERGRECGVRQMFVDPGIGFGKNLLDNLRLLGGLSHFASLGCPIVVGPSRKSFIGAVLDLPVEERLEGTLASVVASIFRGANVVRVHDVKQVKRAVAVADAILHASAVTQT